MPSTAPSQTNRAAQRRVHHPKPVPDLKSLPDDALVTRRQLSALSGYAIPTLKIWARMAKGPRITKIEGRPRYKAADVRDWINASA